MIAKLQSTQLFEETCCCFCWNFHLNLTVTLKIHHCFREENLYRIYIYIYIYIYPVQMNVNGTFQDFGNFGEL
jgi:hypothetical protein